MSINDKNNGVSAITQERIIEIIFRVHVLASIGYLATVAMLNDIPSNYEKKSAFVDAVCELCSCYAHQSVNLKSKSDKIFTLDSQQTPELN